jgi:ABC-2 type transport system ATP-binding protein
VIEIENLTRRFARFDGTEVVAVENLNLRVNAGEIFGFLGPNGVGKTTTIRMLTCLLGPTSGTARINDLEIGVDDQAIRRSVGLLSENPGFYDSLSAEKNLLFFARLYGVDNPPHEVEQFLKWLGLWDRRCDPVGTFSKGMRQKLGLARAAMHSPEVLFLDEPTSGLDPDVARQMREFMISLKEAGRTIFLCTHNLDEADRLCDRVAVFRHRLIDVDTPANLRRRLFGHEIAFTLADVQSEWVRMIRDLPFVSECRLEEHRVIVRLNDPPRQTPVMVRKLVEAGANIQSVTEVNRSLEEIYIRLVRDHSIEKE